MDVLRKYQGPIYAALRIVAGFLYACHGAQKLFGVLGGTQVTQPLMMVAGVIEFGGGLLIALGLFVGIASFIASGQMATAYFMAHFPGGFWPIQNHGELPVLYSFLFLYVAARGAGIASLDGLRAAKSQVTALPIP
ncbi:MAG: DoxX family protein [Acidobacteriota bacterium]